jgi:hypothetical protein
MRKRPCGIRVNHEYRGNYHRWVNQLLFAAGVAARPHPWRSLMTVAAKVEAEIARLLHVEH